MPDINAKNLQFLRRKRNLTLEALAENSGVSRATISRIENGRGGSNHLITVERLASTLNSDVETLTGPDLNEDGENPIFGRKTQMNVRIADDARNALALVAMRYSTKPAHIIHLAPFLFLWAAETSLKRRKEAVEAISAQLEALNATPKPKHLHGLVTDHWRAEEILEAEEKSIQKLDIFGKLVPDEYVSQSYEESEENPFAAFLKSLADDLGDLAEFDYWMLSWDQPGYQLGETEAHVLTGGNEEAARQIVCGHAPLHELPKSVEEAGPDAVASWAIETGQNYRREHFPDFDSISVNLDPESNHE